jgi:hypothetical protein
MCVSFLGGQEHKRIQFSDVQILVKNIISFLQHFLLATTACGAVQRPTLSPMLCVPQVLPQGQSSRAMKLAIHLHLSQTTTRASSDVGFN